MDGIDKDTCIEEIICFITPKAMNNFDEYISKVFPQNINGIYHPYVSKFSVLNFNPQLNFRGQSRKHKKNQSYRKANRIQYEIFDKFYINKLFELELSENTKKSQIKKQTITLQNNNLMDKDQSEEYIKISHSYSINRNSRKTAKRFRSVEKKFDESNEDRKNSGESNKIDEEIKSCETILINPSLNNNQVSDNFPPKNVTFDLKSLLTKNNIENQLNNISESKYNTEQGESVIESNFAPQIKDSINRNFVDKNNLFVNPLTFNNNQINNLKEPVGIQKSNQDIIKKSLVKSNINAKDEVIIPIHKKLKNSDKKYSGNNSPSNNLPKSNNSKLNNQKNFGFKNAQTLKTNDNKKDAGDINNNFPKSEPVKECIICLWKFPENMTDNEINSHTLKCIDGKGLEDKDNYYATLEAIKLINEKKPVETGQDKLCPICKKYVNENPKLLEKHVNSCLNKTESQDKMISRKRSTRNIEDSLFSRKKN